MSILRKVTANILFVTLTLLVLGFTPAFAAVQGKALNAAQVAKVNFKALAKNSSTSAATGVQQIAVPFRPHGAAPAPTFAPVDFTKKTTAAAPSPLAPPPPQFTGFQAIPDNNTFIPPDTMGAVGPNHVMTTLNSQVQIQDRLGNVLSIVPSYDYALGVTGGFWEVFQQPPYNQTRMFDPRITYDPIGQRFIYVISSNNDTSTNSLLLVAISDTDDPTDGWSLFWVAPVNGDTLFADFTCLGHNKNWITVTFNMFDSTDTFDSAQIITINKPSIYAGTISALAFPGIQDGMFAAQPAVTLDPDLNTEYLAEDWAGASGQIRLSRITGTPAAPALDLGYDFPASPTMTWNSAGTNAPQLGSADLIEMNDSRMGNCVYRNNSLWCAQPIFPATSSAGRSSIQFWQVDPTTTDGSVIQNGFVDAGDVDDNVWYNYPSIAVNKTNDVLLGYSAFSAAQFASGNYSFRYGTDLPAPFSPPWSSRPARPPISKFRWRTQQMGRLQRHGGRSR